MNIINMVIVMTSLRHLANLVEMTETDEYMDLIFCAHQRGILSESFKNKYPHLIESFDYEINEGPMSQKMKSNPSLRKTVDKPADETIPAKTKMVYKSIDDLPKDPLIKGSLAKKKQKQSTEELAKGEFDYRIVLPEFRMPYDEWPATEMYAEAVCKGIELRGILAKATEGKYPISGNERFNIQHILPKVIQNLEKWQKRLINHPNLIMQHSPADVAAGRKDPRLAPSGPAAIPIISAFKAAGSTLNHELDVVNSFLTGKAKFSKEFF